MLENDKNTRYQELVSRLSLDVKFGYFTFQPTMETLEAAIAVLHSTYPRNSLALAFYYAIYEQNFVPTYRTVGKLLSIDASRARKLVEKGIPLLRDVLKKLMGDSIQGVLFAEVEPKQTEVKIKLSTPISRTREKIMLVKDYFVDKYGMVHTSRHQCIEANQS